MYCDDLLVTSLEWWQNGRLLIRLVNLRRNHPPVTIWNEVRRQRDELQRSSASASTGRPESGGHPNGSGEGIYHDLSIFDHKEWDFDGVFIGKTRTHCGLNGIFIGQNIENESLNGILTYFDRGTSTVNMVICRVVWIGCSWNFQKMEGHGGLNGLLKGKVQRISTNLLELNRVRTGSHGAFCALIFLWKMG